MRALLIPGDGVAEMTQLPDPVPGQGEVVIRVHRSGICGTDLHFLEESREERGERARIVPGHESAGVIAAVGPGVVHGTVGDRVIGYHHIGCGSCRWCRADLPTQCERKTITGRTRHGSNAEYELLPEWAAIPLPDLYSFDHGVLLSCNISTAYSALAKANVGPGTRVAVFGQGVVGMSAVMLAAALGAHVAAVDLSDARLATSAELGAGLIANPANGDVIAAVREWSGGRGVNVALECSGTGPAVRGCLDVLGPEGTLVFVGGGARIDAKSDDLLGRELRLVGTSVYRPSEFYAFTRLIEDERLDLDRLISRTFAPEEAPAAYAMAGNRNAKKLLFDWVGAR